jgi:hypothetical protein
MADIPLTPEQEAEAQRLAEAMQQTVLDEVRQMARLLASKDDRHLLGQTEFDLRDAAHRLAAKVVEGALAGRQKGGTAGRA